ncbi:hypothetical protein BB559_002049, partial [Furculomyces boomerangus]
MTGTSSQPEESIPTVDSEEAKNNMGPKMPTIFPGAPGAPMFDGEGLTEFILYYEIITINVSSEQKTMLFPYYCNANVRTKVTKSNAYLERNWEQFKIVLKDFFDKDEDETEI